MNSPRLPRNWLSFLLIGALLMSPVLLQGCDSISGLDDDSSSLERSDIPSSSHESKLRHANLLSRATKQAPGQAGKSGALDVSLFLAFNEYEADGITPRVLNRYEVTERILQEYGITRRVLNKYGITHRVLNQYGITRRVLNKYDVVHRVLNKYGITPRVLSRYGDQITRQLLDEFNITDAQLEQDGVTSDDINDVNTMAALLTENDLTAEKMVNELETALSSVRLKVFVENAHLGISIAIEADVLDAFLEEINDDPDVLWAEPDAAFSTSDLGLNSGAWYDQEIVPWGITAVNTPIPSFFEMFGADYIKDNPVHVYVLDSGAMPDSWLDDLSYVEKKDFTMLFENPDQLTWEETLAPDVSGFDPGTQGNPYDESGHGTHIAGTIGAVNDLIGVVGVAPGVRIHSLKVLTADGRTDVTTLLAAVDYVTRAKRENPQTPVVVNLSLGMDIGSTTYNVLDEAIAASIEEGVIYVAAAGNDGMDASTYSPAHVEGVITVGAYDMNNRFAPFSNYGPAVDILAPGVDIISLSHLIEEVHSFESILASGTSYATPHVTGAVARYLGSHPNATASEVQAALTQSASSSIVGVPNQTPVKSLDVGRLLEVETTGEAENPVTPLSGPGNVLDRFAEKSFSGNDGSDTWGGDWAEIGESDGKSSGKIRVDDSSKCASGYCLKLDTGKKNRGVRRAVNLNGVSQATLSFDYRRNDIDEDNLHVEVSRDGGNSWTRLYTFREGSDSRQKSKTFDVTPYASADTQIRFIVLGESGENKVYIDNIEIAY